MSDFIDVRPDGAVYDEGGVQIGHMTFSHVGAECDFADSLWWGEDGQLISELRGEISDLKEWVPVIESETDRLREALEAERASHSALKQFALSSGATIEKIKQFIAGAQQ